MLDRLSGCKWFATLDVISGYWQVDVAPEDRENTVFCTTWGLYEFNVTPFGLCNAPATFQRLMNTILAGQWESLFGSILSFIKILEFQIHNSQRNLMYLLF